LSRKRAVSCLLKESRVSFRSMAARKHQRLIPAMGLKGQWGRPCATNPVPGRTDLNTPIDGLVLDLDLHRLSLLGGQEIHAGNSLVQLAELALQPVHNLG
jgi:hypothetical protein